MPKFKEVENKDINEITNVIRSLGIKVECL